MTNIDQAADIISYRQYQETGKVNAPLNPGSVAEQLGMDGLLTPAPQIIRTVAELEALDPHTLLTTQNRSCAWTANSLFGRDLPAVVVATGEQVRRRKAQGGHDRLPQQLQCIR